MQRVIHWLNSITIPVVVGVIGVYFFIETQRAAAFTPPSFLLAQATGFENLEDFDYWFNLCQQQTDAGDYEKALAACEQAIVVEPESSDTWALRSYILLQMQSYPDAIASADRALVFDPEYSLVIAYKCIAYTHLNDNETALDMCNEALRVNGNWGNETPALAWFHRGMILSQAGQYEQAMIAFDRTLLIEPNDSLTLAYQCQALVELQQYEVAITNCQAALSGNGNWGNESPAIAWTDQGRAQARLRNYDAAIAAYDQSINLDPNNALTWTEQGLVLQQLQRFAEALTSYDRAVAIQPTASLAQLGRCTVLNRLQQYEPALAACDAAIQGDGQWGESELTDVWNQRSIALAGQGQYEEALASINRSVGMNPENAEAFNHQGVILWHLGDYEAALASNQQAIDMEPNNATTWFNRGVIFRSLERYEEALNAYSVALQLAPDNAALWANQSVVLWHLQQYPDALVAAQQSTAIDPDFAQGWFNQATVLVAMGQFETAISAYDRVLDLMPENADALTGKGTALIQLRRYEEAIAALQASLSINPDQPLAQKNLEIVQQQQQEQQPQPQL